MAVRLCTFPECGRKHVTKGLCAGHARQIRDGEQLRPLRDQISKAEKQRLTSQGLKWCPGCSQAKPFDAFSKDKYQRDGLRGKCQECNNAANLEYYSNNGEARREYARQYRDNNREAKRESDRQYRANNCDARREYNREYQANNLEAARERSRQWATNNPDKARANSARRRARQLDATVEVFTTEELHAHWLSKGIDPEKCWYCAKPVEHYDHFEPLSRGGKHSMDNLVPACASCNLSKHARCPWEFISSMISRIEAVNTDDGVEFRIYREESTA
jgi:5-methylcytosine-specific restriction endonuclease McrA